jgi:hypothetical protein
MSRIMHAIEICKFAYIRYYWQTVMHFKFQIYLFIFIFIYFLCSEMYFLLSSAFKHKILFSLLSFIIQVSVIPKNPHIFSSDVLPLRSPSSLDIDSNNHLWIIGSHGTGSDKYKVLFQIPSRARTTSVEFHSSRTPQFDACYDQ